MNALVIVSHAGHYAAMMSLVGSYGFLLFIAGPAIRAVHTVPTVERDRLTRFLTHLIWWSLGLAFVTGALWLVTQASSMSGLPLDRALSPPILGTVLTKTLFGQVWQIRATLTVILAVYLLIVRMKPSERSWRRHAVFGGIVSAINLAALGFVGHANSEAGAEHLVHLTADMVHLLASAAWLGALIPLVFVLTPRHGSSRGWLAVARNVTHRFSAVGITSVGSLVVTGLVNCWFLVGNVAGLVGTDYGRLLMVKLALFGLMLSLAAVNRQRLTPEIEALTRRATVDTVPGCMRWLRRNALTETTLGLALLGVLAVISTSTPALHTQAVWPFPYDLSWVQATMLDPSVKRPVIVAAVAAILGAGAIAFGLWRGHRWIIATAAACLTVALVVPVRLLAVPAYPTTYFHSPIRYNALSIARGEPIYMSNCVPCHGAEGYGDGPVAASLPIRPANLTGEHLFHHGEGTLFWWVSNGIAGTPMPAFGQTLRENERWDLLNYLRAQADAEQANIMDANVEPWRPVVAPDFAFQIGDQGQQTLRQLRGRAMVLLVLFSDSDSLPRLRQLDAAKEQLEHAGVRILAIPQAREGLVEASAKDLGLHNLTIAEAGPEAVAAYSVFRRTPTVEGVPPMPSHMEFLIDRSGYLRFRWSPVYGPGWSQMAGLLKRVEFLNREPPRPPAPEGHVH